MNKLRRNRLTAAVHLTLLLALPGLAAAQDSQEENTLDTIASPVPASNRPTP